MDSSSTNTPQAAAISLQAFGDTPTTSPPTSTTSNTGSTSQDFSNLQRSTEFSSLMFSVATTSTAIVWILPSSPLPSGP